MVLDFGESIFKPSIPGVDDEGFMSVVGQGNLVQLAVISTDGPVVGVLTAMWDFDDTTFYGIFTVGGGTHHVKFDLLKRKNNLIIQAYFEITWVSNTTLTIATSFDNSTWTTVYTRAVTSTVKDSLSVNVDARYIRFETVTPSGNAGFKIFSIDIRKVVNE